MGVVFISFSQNSFSHSIDRLLHVVKEISSWMTSYLLCLNPLKTEFILIGLQEQLNKFQILLFPSTLTLYPPTHSLQILLFATYVSFFIRTLVFPITSPIFLALASCTS